MVNLFTWAFKKNKNQKQRNPEPKKLDQKKKVKQ
jgi:hypothetical protein